MNNKILGSCALVLGVLFGVLYWLPMSGWTPASATYVLATIVSLPALIFYIWSLARLYRLGFNRTADFMLGSLIVSAILFPSYTQYTSVALFAVAMLIGGIRLLKASPTQTLAGPTAKTWRSVFRKLFFVAILPIIAAICISSILGIVLSLHQTWPAQQISQQEDLQAVFIQDIYPNPAHKGDFVTVSGRNLSGFEGDVYFFLERSDGKTLRLQGTLSEPPTGNETAVQKARVKLAEPCEPGQMVFVDYSGKPSTCDYVEITPGTYTFYTKPWGKTSNSVSITILK